MKLELPISSSYVPTWGVIEGLREIMQNARDAITEHDAKFCTSYNATKQKFIVKTDGVTIDRKALVLGVTSKRNREDLIGEHGEGLALGLLALCREHKDVLIRLQDETWKPQLKFSDKWNEVVLCFDVKKVSRLWAKPRVWVEIGGVSPMDHDELRRRIRWFPGRVNTGEEISIAAGTILLDPSERGCIYAKGIFIQRVADYAHGYDFGSLRVDRDRGMVDDWDLSYAAAQAITDAVASEDMTAKHFLDLCDKESADLKRLESHTYRFRTHEPLRQKLADAWLDRVGDGGAIPVANEEEVQELSYWKLKGVVVHSAGLLEVLQIALERNKTTALQEAGRGVIETFNVNQLTEIEQKNLSQALTLLEDARCLNGEPVQIGQFKSDTMLGLWQPAVGITIARKVLGDTIETMRSIIHELAHDKSHAPDGTTIFEAKLEELWGKVTRHLMFGEAAECPAESTSESKFESLSEPLGCVETPF